MISLKLIYESLTTNYKTLGRGLHGVALYRNRTKDVLKITTSEPEIDTVKAIINYSGELRALPKIEKLHTIDKDNIYISRILRKPVNDTVYAYIRPFYAAIDDELQESIDEYTQMGEFADFFFSNARTVAKSQTDIDYEFDEKFVKFIETLKQELKTIDRLHQFDDAGLPTNIGLDSNNDYVLYDF